MLKNFHPDSLVDKLKRCRYVMVLRFDKDQRQVGTTEYKYFDYYDYQKGHIFWKGGGFLPLVSCITGCEPLVYLNENRLRVYFENTQMAINYYFI